nr:hypothetical protein [Tanacetum cinerariifolium]
MNSPADHQDEPELGSLPLSHLIGIKRLHDDLRVTAAQKDQIWFDEKVARNLEAQLQAELEEKERLARQKEKEANIANDRIEGSKTKAKRSSKRVGEELKSDKSKKQKLDEQVEAKVDNDQEEAEMKMYMKIIPDDEITIDAIPLATKPPIMLTGKSLKKERSVPIIL